MLSCITLSVGTLFINGGCDSIPQCYQLSETHMILQPSIPLSTCPRWRDLTRHTVATGFVQSQGGDDGACRGWGRLSRTQLDKEKMLNQQCDVKSPALTREPMASKRRTEYENGPSRWCGKRDAKQYQVSVIPLNKMREIEEQIQAEVDSRMAIDG